MHPFRRPTPPRQPGTAAALVALVAVTALLAGVATPAAADEPPLRDGRYTITVETTLPNVMRAVPRSSVQRCVSAAQLADGSLFEFPDQKPDRPCAASEHQRDGDSLRYQLRCPGPDGATGSARVQWNAESFDARLRLRRGGKNMTMMLDLAATRTGDCTPKEQP